jgi:hypothetical protein
LGKNAPFVYMVFTKTAVMLGRADSLSTTEFFLIKQDIPRLKHQQDTQPVSAFTLNLPFSVFKGGRSQAVRTSWV